MTPTDGDYVSLREYIETQIRNLERTIAAAYPDRKELLEIINKMNERLTELERAKNVLDGKASQTTVIIFGAITVIAFLLSLIDWFVGK